MFAKVFRSDKSKSSASVSSSDSLGTGNTPAAGSAAEDPLRQLAKFDTVLVVDDSGSMGGALWKEARDALGDLANLASKYDKDGIDIRFLNSAIEGNGLTGSQVKALFKTVQPRARTPIGKRLREILKPYLQQLQSGKQVKPLNMIIITDGVPTDQDSGIYTEAVIIETAKALDKAHAPLSQVGIQFVQIGSDPAATAFLENLDDSLKHKPENQGMRDIVDTTTGGHELDLVKALTGGINRRMDAATTSG